MVKSPITRLQDAARHTLDAHAELLGLIADAQHGLNDADIETRRLADDACIALYKAEDAINAAWLRTQPELAS